MIARLHGFVDIENLAVLSDVIRPSIGQAAGVEASEGFGKLFAGIAQDRIVEVQTLRKIFVLFSGIDARGEIRNIEVADQIATLTE